MQPRPESDSINWGKLFSDAARHLEIFLDYFGSVVVRFKKRET